MKKRLGSYLLTFVALFATGVLVLVGCDKSLVVDNLLSPEADVQIVRVELATGDTMNPFIGEIVGSAGNGQTTPTTVVAYPEAVLRIQVFNGVDVRLNRFLVEYFESDGIRPLQLAPGVRVDNFQGPLTVFVRGNRVSEFNPSTIAPQASTGTPGIVGDVRVQVPVVSDDLVFFLTGGDGDLTNGNEFPDLVAARLTLFGEDVNGNHVEVQCRIAIGTRLSVKQRE